MKFFTPIGHISTIGLETQLGSSYRWMLELAEHKWTKFPCLEKVTLLEEHHGPQVSVDWAYPKRY
jgi:hypothetical protein